MQSRFTLSQILSWHPCWDPTNALAVTGQSDWSVLELWEHCRSDSERVWVATRPGVLAPRALRGWVANIVERVLAQVVTPDPRSRAVVAALRAAEPVSPEVVTAVCEAINAASAAGVADDGRVSAYSVAWAACYDTGYTSSVYASIAAYDIAACVADVADELLSQIAELRVLLKG